MNTAQLECFVSLAGTLNFMKTAEQLGLTQPAISKQIKAIEDELGAKLFNRTSRSVTLTTIGRQFLPEATNMLNIFYRSKQWIGSYYREQKNHIRIGYADPHAIQFISNVLKATISEFGSDITPELVIGQTDENLGRLQKDQLDIVVGMRDARFNDDAVYFTKIADNGFKFVIAKDHPFAIEYLKSQVSNTAISSEDFWNLRQVLDIPPYLLKNFFSRGHRIVPVNDTLDNVICSNINEAYGIVLAGIGFALIPDHLIMDHPDLLFLDWKESPHASFGIYHRKIENKESPLHLFLKSAKNQQHWRSNSI